MIMKSAIASILKKSSCLIAPLRIVLLVQLLILVVAQTPVFCELSSGPEKEYLAREYAWAVFIDLSEIDQFLNYQGSLLHPLTKARMSYRYYDDFRGDDISGAKAASSNSGTSEASNRSSRAGIYEELWYSKGRPVGCKSISPLQLPQRKPGVIVVKQMGNAPDHPRAAANAILRLLVDLQVKGLSPAFVMVPASRYDEIVIALEHYRFSPLTEAMPKGFAGAQLTIHLRSYPPGKDEAFCYQK
jgi:hypothetical protein